MYLYRYRKRPNFGDDLNAWIWPKVLNVALDSVPNQREMFVGIGTLLNERLPFAERTYVMGSGAGYGSVSSAAPGNWIVHFVRGPLTAKALGLSQKSVISDPALYLNQLVKERRDTRFKCSFLPHHAIDSPRYREVCESVGVHYVSPELPCDQVIEEIAASERLICGALHGAITAEALRVPWLPVLTNSDILESKWHDWAASIEMTVDFHTLPTIYPRSEPSLRGLLAYKSKALIVKAKLLSLQRTGRFVLGSEKVLTKRVEQMAEVFDRFNRNCDRT